MNLDKRLKAYDEGTSSWMNILTGGVSNTEDNKVYTYGDLKQIEDKYNQLETKFNVLNSKIDFGSISKEYAIEAYKDLLEADPLYKTHGDKTHIVSIPKSYETTKSAFIGFVNSIDFVSNLELSTKIGLSAGDFIGNTDDRNVWMKFLYNKKIIFIPVKPLKRNVSVKNLSDIDGITPIDKVVTIGTTNYKVRLPKGQESIEGDNLLNNEYDVLLLPMTQDFLTTFNDNEVRKNMSFNINLKLTEMMLDVKNLCKNTDETKYIINRAGYDIKEVPEVSTYETQTASLWRPVLEFIPA